VKELKPTLYTYLNEVHGDGKLQNKINIKYLRLRGKMSGNKPGRIFIDSQSLKQNLPGLRDGSELAIQAVPAMEVVGANDRAVFVQNFVATPRKLDRKFEIMAKKNVTIGEFKILLASLFESVDKDNVLLARGPLTKLTLDAAAALPFKPHSDDIMMRLPPLNVRDNDLIVFCSAANLKAAQSAAAAERSSAAKKPLSSSKFRGKRGPAGVTVVAKKMKEPAPMKIYTQDDIDQMEAIRLVEQAEQMERMAKAAAATASRQPTSENTAGAPTPAPAAAGGTPQKPLTK